MRKYNISAAWVNSLNNSWCTIKVTRHQKLDQFFAKSFDITLSNLFPFHQIDIKAAKFCVVLSILEIALNGKVLQMLQKSIDSSIIFDKKHIFKWFYRLTILLRQMLQTFNCLSRIFLKKPLNMLLNKSLIIIFPMVIFSTQTHSIYLPCILDKILNPLLPQHLLTV